MASKQDKTNKLLGAVIGAQNKQQSKVEKNSEPKKTPAEANPKHGEKGDFVKLTITLPPDIYEKLVIESTRRKVTKAGNTTVSAIIRDILGKHIDEI